MITFVKLTCPSCGANLEVDRNLKSCFCTYCGTKILLHNENEKVERYIDEAALAKQENERRKIEIEQQKEAEYKARKAEEEANSKFSDLFMGLCFAAFFPTLILLGGILVGVANGRGFLDFLMTMLCVLDLALLWYGAVVGGLKEYTVPKWIGVVLLIIAAVISFYCGKWWMNLPKPDPTTSACLLVFSL